MRPIDSAYDRMTAETRSADPGARRYALMSDHSGPCTLTGEYSSLEDAIEAARTMDTDAAPTDLEDDLDVDAMGDSGDADPCAWLIEQAEAHGWTVVAQAPAGEYWTVLVRDAQ